MVVFVFLLMCNRGDGRLISETATNDWLMETELGRKESWKSETAAVVY